MTNLATCRIAGSGGLLRIVTCRPADSMLVMRSIGFAGMTAEVTTCLAYRKMIDTCAGRRCCERA